MKHGRFIARVALAAAVGLSSMAGCGEDVEADTGGQSSELWLRRDAGRPPNPGGQCRSDADCPVILLCKLCPDGSCADPNVHCVEGQCSAPNYTCSKPPADAGASQCKSDFDCPITDVCRLCEDGSCASPNVHCVDGQCSAPNYTCPAQPTGKPCASTQQCDPGQYCTVEDGVCNRPPGCLPGKVCITLCYGTCETGPAS